MYKNQDWEKAQGRYKAFWEGKLQGPIIQVTAPRHDMKQEIGWFGSPDIIGNLDDFKNAVFRYEKWIGQLYFGGDAFPNFWIDLGPTIAAAYLGADVEVREETTWIKHIVDLDKIEGLGFDENNKWWKKTKEITATAAEMSNGRYFVGITDLGGILDILAALRGTQNLLFDLVDYPERVLGICSRINQLWLRYYNELNGIIQKKMNGSAAWLGLWSPDRWYPIECDFSAMISPDMFKRFVVPQLEEQCRYLDNTIYHMDGPGQIPHLEHILAIKELDGIEWVPTDGQVASPEWVPLYRKIQSAGKRLVLKGVPPDRVEFLLNNISGKGLCLRVQHCSSEEEANMLLEKVKKPASDSF